MGDLPPRATALAIVSGGQTGADRGALEAALALGLPCGGWCPKGRRAEDGRIPGRFPLRETASPEYPVRTARNVRDSDGTVILHAGPVDRGTALTERLVRRSGRELLILDVRTADPAELRDWVVTRGIRVLNVAGPRESRAPGLQARVRRFVEEAFLPLPPPRG